MSNSETREQLAITPMLKQYWQIKSDIKDKDTILFFRLGDFYEMFFDDAKIASEILDITLTSRNKNDPNPVPLCGIPYHAADGYIAKLLTSGKKVAICEQVEDPKAAKGIVRREIIKIITPGVLLETESLIASRNNYLMSINRLPKGAFSFALCDVSTGDFRAAVLNNSSHLSQEISRIEPSEVLISRSLAEDQLYVTLKSLFEKTLVTILDDPNFDSQIDSDIDLGQIAGEAYSAVGAVLRYLQNTQKVPLNHIQRVYSYNISQHMIIDESTKRNLELSKTMADGSAKGSLIWLLDKTKTAMGGRTLRRWLFYPLMNVGEINERLDAVETIKDDFHLAEGMSEDLKKIADIERITSRVVIGSANARELNSLKESLRALPKLKDSLKETSGLLKKISDGIDPCLELASRIENSIVDEPPLSVKEGGLIRRGVSKELDELHDISTSGKDFIARLEVTERQRTGISSLKVRYNKVFGYYIEVTHTHAEKVPENYIRKQTLTNAERFITPELKEYEEKVLGAHERICQLEYQLFTELKKYASGFALRLAETADALGRLDTIASLAYIANQNRYCKPVINGGDEIKIVAGRHPIIEVLNPTERFVPNDTHLDNSECRMMVITGPNMAGKSTVMRQVALISLMAQIGSFVPATDATLPLIDRIFTRVGASDNLIKGQSTFMVEMNEAATILKEATPKSLILIDEIGRGTSTFDGVSIAWAVAEYLYDKVLAKTLFATHYHELTDLALTKPGIKNFNVAVKEWNDRIIFLRKLVAGSVNRSYGIQVARLAGLPLDVISKAKEILVKLEKGEIALRGTDSNQMALFNTENSTSLHPEGVTAFHPRGVRKGESGNISEVECALKDVNLDTITPIEALNVLNKLKSMV